MKFDRFVKIAWLAIAVIALVLFYLYIQAHSIYVIEHKNAFFKINKLTGEVQICFLTPSPSKRWLTVIE